jgi:hypothetical protein
VRRVDDWRFVVLNGMCLGSKRERTAIDTKGLQADVNKTDD